MKFTSEHLFKILVGLDAQLKTPLELILVDLPYLQLVYTPPGESGNATPVDTDMLRRAYDTAVARSGIRMPLTLAQASDFPFLFESRLSDFATQGLKHLKLKLASRHDVVAWLLLRQDKRAIADIQSMGQASHLSFEPLLDSFCAVDASHRNIRAARAQFLALVGERFGKTCETQAKTALRERLG